GKAESAPGAMKSEQINGDLNQIVAGDDDEDVERYEQRKIERHPRLRAGEGSHAEPFWWMGSGNPCIAKAALYDAAHVGLAQVYSRIRKKPHSEPPLCRPRT